MHFLSLEKILVTCVRIVMAIEARDVQYILRCRVVLQRMFITKFFG